MEDTKIIQCLHNIRTGLYDTKQQLYKIDTSSIDSLLSIYIAGIDILISRILMGDEPTIANKEAQNEVHT